MLSSIIKVKLEKNCCPFEKLENFFAENPSYGLADKGRHRNRGLFRLHGVGNQNRKNMN